ncbi:hypothetical protein BS17DRAFT_819737 [Gyrodon lividus]|nr:hypothetical protein BS17DRAFT_819737 [Gyrodon lividus]
MGWGCIDSGHVPKEMKLNVSTLFDPNALTLPMTILSHDIPNFPALIKTYSVPPILLHLFDGMYDTHNKELLTIHEVFCF